MIYSNQIKVNKGKKRILGKNHVKSKVSEKECLLDYIMWLGKGEALCICTVKGSSDSVGKTLNIYDGGERVIFFWFMNRSKRM